MRLNEDIFGCFGNTIFENCTAICCPCFIFSKILGQFNDQQELLRAPKSECNGCTGGLVYCCFCCMPCIPGSYLRILRGEEIATGCLSYTFFPCCALLQDQRRLQVQKPAANKK